MSNGPVLVDTSVWIDYFRGDPETVRRLDRVIDSERVLVCGLILQEVLQGARNSRAFERLRREMSIWDYAREQPEDYVEAAGLFAGLRWRGLTIPPSDCLIAALTLRLEVSILAQDSHFELIPGLRLL